jgi:ribosomal protein S12 methylthiotransferase
VKQERRARFMLKQERISAQRLQRRVGRTLRVLVDAIDADGANARSSADAPEIDGTVHVAPDRSLKVGDFATVRVTRAGVHDLWAEVQ